MYYLGFRIRNKDNFCKLRTVVIVLAHKGRTVTYYTRKKNENKMKQNIVIFYYELLIVS